MARNPLSPNFRLTVALIRLIARGRCWHCLHAVQLDLLTNDRRMRFCADIDACDRRCRARGRRTSSDGYGIRITLGEAGPHAN